MRTLADEITRTGGKPRLVRGDLSKRGEAKRVVNEAAEALGGLDVLINNAGGLGERRPLADIDDQLFDFVFDLNVRAVLAASTAAVSHFEKRGGGNIINVGSIAGIDGGGSGASLYAIRESGGPQSHASPGQDLAAKNIRVNTVAPGAIATPFHARTPAARMEAMRDATAWDASVWRRLRRLLPVPRIQRTLGLHHREHDSRERRHVHAMTPPPSSQSTGAPATRASRFATRRAVARHARRTGRRPVPRTIRGNFRRGHGRLARQPANCRPGCAAWWAPSSAGSRHPIYLARRISTSSPIRR